MPDRIAKLKKEDRRLPKASVSSSDSPRRISQGIIGVRKSRRSSVKSNGSTTPRARSPFAELVPAKPRSSVTVHTTVNNDTGEIVHVRRKSAVMAPARVSTRTHRSDTHQNALDRAIRSSLNVNQNSISDKKDSHVMKGSNNSFISLSVALPSAKRLSKARSPAVRQEAFEQSSHVRKAAKTNISPAVSPQTKSQPFPKYQKSSLQHGFVQSEDEEADEAVTSDNIDLFLETLKETKISSATPTPSIPSKGAPEPQMSIKSETFTEESTTLQIKPVTKTPEMQNHKISENRHNRMSLDHTSVDRKLAASDMDAPLVHDSGWSTPGWEDVPQFPSSLPTQTEIATTRPLSIATSHSSSPAGTKSSAEPNADTEEMFRGMKVSWLIKTYNDYMDSRRTIEEPTSDRSSPGTSSTKGLRPLLLPAVVKSPDALDKLKVLSPSPTRGISKQSCGIVFGSPRSSPPEPNAKKTNVTRVLQTPSPERLKLTRNNTGVSQQDAVELAREQMSSVSRWQMNQSMLIPQVVAASSELSYDKLPQDGSLDHSPFDDNTAPDQVSHPPPTVVTQPTMHDSILPLGAPLVSPMIVSETLENKTLSAATQRVRLVSNKVNFYDPFSNVPATVPKQTRAGSPLGKSSALPKIIPTKEVVPLPQSAQHSRPKKYIPTAPANVASDTHSVDQSADKDLEQLLAYPQEPKFRNPGKQLEILGMTNDRIEQSDHQSTANDDLVESSSDDDLLPKIPVRKDLGSDGTRVPSKVQRVLGISDNAKQFQLKQHTSLRRAKTTARPVSKSTKSEKADELPNQQKIGVPHSDVLIVGGIQKAPPTSTPPVRRLVEPLLDLGSGSESGDTKDAPPLRQNPPSPTSMLDTKFGNPFEGLQVKQKASQKSHRKMNSEPMRHLQSAALPRSTLDQSDSEDAKTGVIAIQIDRAAETALPRTRPDTSASRFDVVSPSPHTFSKAQFVEQNLLQDFRGAISPSAMKPTLKNTLSFGKPQNHAAHTLPGKEVAFPPVTSHRQSSNTSEESANVSSDDAQTTMAPLILEEALPKSSYSFENYSIDRPSSISHASTQSYLAASSPSAKVSADLSATPFKGGDGSSISSASNNTQKATLKSSLIHRSPAPEDNITIDASMEPPITSKRSSRIRRTSSVYGNRTQVGRPETSFPIESPQPSPSGLSAGNLFNHYNIEKVVLTSQSSTAPGMRDPLSITSEAAPADRPTMPESTSSNLKSILIEEREPISERLLTTNRFNRIAEASDSNSGSRSRFGRLSVIEQSPLLLQEPVARMPRLTSPLSITEQDPLMQEGVVNKSNASGTHEIHGLGLGISPPQASINPFNQILQAETTGRSSPRGLTTLDRINRSASPGQSPRLSPSESSTSVERIGFIRPSSATSSNAAAAVPISYYQPRAKTQNHDPFKNLDLKQLGSRTSSTERTKTRDMSREQSQDAPAKATAPQEVYISRRLGSPDSQASNDRQYVTTTGPSTVKIATRPSSAFIPRTTSYQKQKGKEVVRPASQMLAHEVHERFDIRRALASSDDDDDEARPSETTETARSSYLEAVSPGTTSEAFEALASSASQAFSKWFR